jgi:biopolymer transport protein TolR
MAGRRSLFPDADEGGFGRTKRSGDADLDITPMIDVTFLLLIFFMVTSTMKSDRELDIPVAQYGVGVETRLASVIVIKAGGPSIYFGEDANAAEADIDDVRPYIEEAAREGRMEVIIKADREVPNGFVQQVARVVAAVDGVSFFIGVRDKPLE